MPVCGFSPGLANGHFVDQGFNYTDLILTFFLIYEFLLQEDFFFSFLKGLVARLCPTLCNPMDCHLLGSSVHGIPGKNTGVGSHSFLWGSFPTKG